LVGDIWDENDDIVNEWQKITDNRYECSGDMNLSDFMDKLELDEDELDTDCATVGGWTVERIGSMPVPFDSFDYQNYTVLVMQVDEDSHRIVRLLVLKHDLSEEKKKVF